MIKRDSYLNKYDVNEYYDGIRHLNIFDFLLEENV